MFVTAEGLLMYRQPDEALELIAQCAKRFPGGRMLFDLPPAWFGWFARRGHRISLRYKVPPMPFRMSVTEAADLVNTVPGIRVVRDLQPPPGRGVLLNSLRSSICRIPALDSLRPTLTLLEFG
ncbi:MAG: hypothetical protein J2P16_13765 [Mycobacterium sp.]|nr:hypothetical protein [Mycobacterium sp.]